MIQSKTVPSKPKKLHYEQSGDNYKTKDPYKIITLHGAKKTVHNLKRFTKKGLTIKEITSSRGESAYRWQISAKDKRPFQIAQVEEGIGTKNTIADALVKEYGPSIYKNIAIDNAASIFNDLTTTGAATVSFLLHIAAWPPEFYTHFPVLQAIIDGTVEACNLAGASWGGGESATMRDIIVPGTSLFSGSATGVIYPASKALSEDKIKVGDRIIVFASSGVHCNGITLLRKELLERLPDGYQTKLSDGTEYGRAILTPTIIYAPLVEKLMDIVDLHYAVHITGHGWRKLMRPTRALSYVVEKLPPARPIFETIQKYSGMSDRDMYDTYNMGGGFAVYVSAKDAPAVIIMANESKIPAWDVGYVAKGFRQVELKPLGIVFKEEEDCK